MLALVSLQKELICSASKMLYAYNSGELLTVIVQSALQPQCML